MTPNTENSNEHKGNIVAYYRVSTEQQGKSGLGLAAQRKAVMDYLNGGSWKLIGEFTEIESGHKSDRPQLELALKLCKRRRATLVIAKLDRLARNVHFISGLMEHGIKFCAVEFPNADPFMLHVHAAMGEHERRLISARTKAGLERAKARGVKLGRHGVVLARQNAARAREQARKLKPVIREIQREGKITIRDIMGELNERGIKTSRNGTWHPQTVSVLLKRVGDTKR
jgi:DNA invertase Pin-like site-specific DNA recombinase